MSGDSRFLGEFEQMILLAVLRVSRADEDAYAVNVHAELAARTGRRVARGAIYVTLDRLEKKGLLTSYVTPPTAARGGRAKRCYTVTKRGLAKLAASQHALTELWQELNLTSGT